MWKAWLIAGAFYSFTSLPCEGQVKGGATPGAFSNVRLRIEAPTSQPVYRIGETIRLELAFTTSGPPQFRLQLVPYSRQPRLTLDLVAIEPQSGWEDPLAGFLRSCALMSEGGLYDVPVLSSDPVKVPLILNEWGHFQRSGDYSVTVRSRRVTAIDAFPNMPQPSVESNRLPLHIIAAERDWQSQTLEDAMRVLNSKMSDSREQREQRSKALDTVRFLGTEEAAHAMARLLASEPYSYELLTGLVGSPTREIVEHEMRSLLVDPHFPVVREFLCAMAIVANPSGVDSATVARQSALEARFREELRAALPQKVGQAREISSVTIDSRP